jgi:hypothetical protein
MAALPYKLYGGATRPDALNFDPGFNTALLNLYQAAPPEVQTELGLTSGYRSPAVQQVLWDRSDKTGHSVARPGRSKHQHGTAADLYGFGLGDGPHVSDATKAWVKANAEAHGLYFPMAHEPWHIQVRGEGGGAPAAAPAAPGGVAGVMASAVDPRAATMGQLEDNPFKAITDAGPKRGGLVGEGSAGGGLTAGAADPGIPALETASATLSPPPPAAGTPKAMGTQLGQLAQLFKVKPVGQAGQAGQAPTRRA